MTDFTREQSLIDTGTSRIAGIDEVGRGPLAGPVVAAAVILDPARIPEGLRDSKKLTPRRRDALFDTIRETAAIGLGQCSVAEIDRLNILQATFEAMRRALAALPVPPGHALVDGNRLPPALGCDATALIGGDDISCSIAAASIIAKVTRDRLMGDLARQFPGYGWQTNAGYGTAEHLAALARLGVTPHHRVSFRPVHNILYQDK
ncbi:MAG: ribonuclease HII [Rhodobacteraceae bacterium]|nr:ribonuclease HII [Paracoccaceae bacterium]